jgi:predicted P-loop ATPase/GTPase
MYNKTIVSKNTNCLPITEDNIVNNRFTLENEEQLTEKVKLNRGPKPKNKDTLTIVSKKKDKTDNSLTELSDKFYPPMLLSVHSRVEVVRDKLVWKEKVKEIVSSLSFFEVLKSMIDNLSSHSAIQSTRPATCSSSEYNACSNE